LIIESATSVLAYGVLFALRHWAAATFADDPAAAGLFAFYGLSILANLITQSATGVLQAFDRFDRLARYGFGQSVVTAGVIAAAFGLWRWQPQIYASRLLMLTLTAYLLGKLYYGASLAVEAVCQSRAHLGAAWWRAPLRALPNPRGMLTFAASTNLNGTINLFTRDNIPLYLAALLSPTEVGYMKIAQGLITPILLVVNPFIWPTYTEITRSVSRGQWRTTRRVLRRVSLVTGGIVALLGGGLALTGWWLIPRLYGAAAAPAYPALLILLVGYGFASVFQWNRPLLLALDKPAWPVGVAFAAGLLELFVIFTLASRYGYLMMAAALAGYFLLSIGGAVWLGLREIARREQRM
jgi:O-antigen/teichoic acid export membrane protein